MKRPPQPPTVDEQSIATYRGAMRVAEADAVHDAYLARGIEALGHGLPYLVQAARWQAASDRRRQARRHALAQSEARGALETVTPLEWDPFERVAQSEVLRFIVAALAALPDEDVLVVWSMCEGKSDDETAAEWDRRGYQPPRPSAEVIRQRRHRAIARLRAAITLKT